MKKIIALFAVVLAFGFSANAQQLQAVESATTQQVQSTNDDAKDAALKDVNRLSDLVKLDATQKASLLNVFLEKHRTLAYPDLSQERFEILADYVEGKIKSALTAEQFSKLKTNAKLLKELRLR